MTRFWNILGGIAAIGVTVAAPVYIHDPAIWKHIGVGVAVLQAAKSLIAHSYNPDGTPAAMPYQPGVETEKLTPKDYQVEEETRN